MTDSSRAWPRARRKTTACLECQKRKQRCNQGQPCSQCKHRFPEPVCEYGQRRKSIAFLVSLPASTPRAYQVGNHTRQLSSSSAKSLRGRRNRTQGLAVKWSGIEIATEYPFPLSPELDSNNEGEAVEERHQPGVDIDTSVDEKQILVHAATVLGERQWLGGRSHGQLVRGGRTVTNKQNLWYLAGPLDSMSSLPIAPTKQNAILIHTFGEVLYRFKGSFDGVPDPDNPFLEHYVPWCIQSPLLIQTSIYISAQPLAARQYIDEQTTMRLKGNAIHVLNSHLRSKDCVSDEAMAAVAQFISIELYYGEAEVMQAHLRGFREMVRLRSGFPSSDVGALVTKVALVGDCTVALALEERPILQNCEGFAFEYNESSPRHPRVSFNSPLMPPRVPFMSCLGELGLRRTTAWILDEVCFLIDAALNLPDDPSEADTSKLRLTANWIQDRISELPASPEPGTLPPPQTQARPHSLLPRYPEFSSSSKSPSSPSPVREKATPSTFDTCSDDPLYTAVRLSSRLLASAIASRQPLSRVCTAGDALAVLHASWRVPLARWRSVVGIFIFVMTAVVPTLHRAAERGEEGISADVHVRFAKSILQIGLMQAGLEDWNSCKGVMGRVVGLWMWLGGERKGKDMERDK